MHRMTTLHKNVDLFIYLRVLLGILT